MLIKSPTPKTNEATGEERERAIPFMNGYAVFNVEQSTDLLREDRTP